MFSIVYNYSAYYTNIRHSILLFGIKKTHYFESFSTNVSILMILTSSDNNKYVRHILNCCLHPRVCDCLSKSNVSMHCLIVFENPNSFTEMM